MDSKCPQTSSEIIALLISRYPELSACEADVRAAHDILLSCYQADGKLLVCGNGGSAADSEHIVGELMKSFRFKRPIDARFADEYLAVNNEKAPDWLEGAMPAISLVSQTALSTAFGNDESSVGVFAQQVYGYGRRGDVLLAITTSGGSVNVIEAAKVARARGMHVIGLTGSRDSIFAAICDVCIKVPRDETFRAQELHLPVYHCLCACIEADMFGGTDE